MKHDDIRHRLSEYIDGSGTPEERAAIEAHLKACPQCSSALEELRKTIGHVKTIEEIEPPAWMAQKIMATVRADAEEKKGFFHRFFFPLRIKLPIQAVAVLFLAITAYYINQTIRPMPEHSEAPVQKFGARNEAPRVSDEQDKLAKADSPAVRSKKIQQAPEYKALDMTLAYEKPAAPIPQDRAAAIIPAPAKGAGQAAQPKDEVTIEHRAAESEAGAPALLQEQAAPQAGKTLQGEIKYRSITAQHKRRLSAAKGSTNDLGAATTESQFQLSMDQTVFFESDNVRLKFLKITEDSRCPIGVQCAWEGQVTVVIRVMTQDQDIGDISLTQRAGNHEDLATTSFENYTLRLIKVEPQPLQGDSVKSSDYRVTLVISKP